MDRIALALNDLDIAATKPQPIGSLSGAAGYAERYYWLRAMIDHIPDFIYAKDLEGRFLFANKALVENNGLRDVTDLIDTTDFDFLPPEAARSVSEIERRVVETGVPDLGFEEQAELGDTNRWLMMSRVPLRDQRGDIIGVVGASRDITIRKDAERLMKAQSHLLEVIARGKSLAAFLNELAVTLTGLKTGIRAAILLGSPPENTLRIVAAAGLPDTYRRQIDRAGLQVAGANEPSTGHYDGQAALIGAIFERAVIPGVHHLTQIFPIPSADGGTEGLVAIHSPIGLDLSGTTGFLATAATMAGIAIARSRAEEQIGYLAHHDGLTGLANRSQFEARLETVVASAKAQSGKAVIAFIDIDNFKLINDSLGHGPGDELLKVVAGRILSETSGIGSVGRLGGDEFVVIFEAADAEACLPRLEALRRAVAAPIAISGLELQVTCSIGMASYPEHGATAADVLTSADMAMYRAKQSGRDCIKTFDGSMVVNSRRKLARTDELRHAIARSEFVLYFQPQQDRSTGRIVGAEALIRWNHPSEGLVYPGDFIPLAEETGLIVPIGEWVVKEACRISKTWRDRGLHAIRTSVNVSARQFDDKALVNRIAQALDETGVDPAALEIEVTESMIMRDLEASILKMTELRNLGLSLAVDDFGTGYSSLSALKRFPLSRLKIDRSFIKDIPTDEDDMAITSAIISLGQKLDLSVIAEGVETEAQAAFLLDCGCSEIQGYLVSRPIPAAAFCEMLAADQRSRD